MPKNKCYSKCIDSAQPLKQAQLVNQIEELKAEVAGGTVLTPSDLDDLVQRVKAIHTPPAPEQP